MGRAYGGVAVQLANRGEREEAEKYFQLALARIDRMTERERYRTRGSYFLAVRNNARAIDEFTALVRDFPADTAGQANLALAYFYAGDSRRALEEAQRSVDLSPRNVLQRSNLALYAMYAGEFDRAEAEARKVLEMNAAYFRAFITLGLCDLARGRFQSAAENYKRAAAASAQGASFAATGLADIALYQGRPGDALPLLARGIDGDAVNGNVAGAAVKSVMVAQSHLMRGQRAEAVAAADRATAGNRQSSVLFPAGVVYLEANQPQKAVRIAKELAAHVEAEPQAYAKILEALGEAGVRRLRLLEEARGLKDTWLGRFEMGRAYLAAGEFAAANGEFERCLKRRGEATAVFLDEVPSFRYFPPVHYYMARAQEGLKSPAAADSYRLFLAIRQGGEPDLLVADARARLGGITPSGATSAGKEP